MSIEVATVDDDPQVPTDADVVAVVSPAQAAAFADAGFTLFEGKDAADGLVYDCRDFVCRLPTSDPAALRLAPRLLSERSETKGAQEPGSGR